MLLKIIALSKCSSLLMQMKHGLSLLSQTKKTHDNPSMGSAMAGGAKTGLTLGLAGNQGDPENRFRTAAMMFVKQKEDSCVIIEGKLLINPQYEYTYKC